MKKRINKKIFYYFFSFTSLLTLTSCDMNSFGDDLASGIESKLFPNIWAFLVQLFALIILLIIVFKFAYKPVHKFLEKRKELLENEVKDTKANKEKSKEYLEEAEKKLAGTKKEASQIIENAKVEANKVSQQIIDDAQKEAYSIKQKANKDIESAKNKAKKELHNEIVDVALNASSQILSREVSAEDNSKLIDQFIDDLNNEKESK